MDEAGVLLREAVGILEGHPDVLFAGFVEDAAKEYAEARLTYALGLDLPLPSPEDLGVWVGSYLHGLGEAVGELRRRLLDLLRVGETDKAESTLSSMDDVVDLLASLDYPDGMTRGLRRTTDVARALVERSRSDLTTTIVQERLRKDLSDHL
jgi:translin